MHPVLVPADMFVPTGRHSRVRALSARPGRRQIRPAVGGHWLAIGGISQPALRRIDPGHHAAL